MRAGVLLGDGFVKRRRASTQGVDGRHRLCRTVEWTLLGLVHNLEIELLGVPGRIVGQSDEDEGEELEHEASSKEHERQFLGVVLEAGAAAVTARGPQQTLRVEHLPEVDRCWYERCENERKTFDVDSFGTSLEMKEAKRLQRRNCVAVSGMTLCLPAAVLTVASDID